MCGPVTYNLPRMAARKNQVAAALTERGHANWLTQKRDDPVLALKIGRFRNVALRRRKRPVRPPARICKIIEENQGRRIFGIQMFHAHSADLVHEATLATQVGATVTQVAEMTHGLPRWLRDLWKRLRMRREALFIRFARR